MMVSFATATVPLKQLLPISPTIASPPRSIPSFSNNVLKSISTNPLSSIFCKLSSDKPVQSSRVFSLPGNQGFWEAPDDGSGSDYDDDEEEEGNNLDFESDWEGGGAEEEEEEEGGGGGGGERVSSDEQYEEDLRKEMEQLLEPEERDILWKNATPNLNRISTAKWNLLHSLALAGQIHHIDMLLENGLHIDLVDKDGLTALHTAVIGKKEPVISHILRRGANPNVTDRDGASPLHYAVQVGAMQTVKLFIKYNVDLNAADKDGWTPLHIAIQSRNRDIAKVLLLNGADKTRRNKDGRTPLDLALCYGREFKSYDLAKLLKLVPAKRYVVVKNSEPKWHPVRVFKSDLPLPRSKSRGMLANSLYLEDFDSEAEAHLNKTGLDISRMGKFKRNVT